MWSASGCIDGMGAELETPMARRPDPDTITRHAIEMLRSYNERAHHRHCLACGRCYAVLLTPDNVAANQTIADKAHAQSCLFLRDVTKIEYDLP
jgi:hypothetical protein